MEVYCISMVHSNPFYKLSIYYFLIPILLVLLMSGCKKEEKVKSIQLVDETVYTTVDYTNLVLDSAAVATYYKEFPERDSIREHVFQFYSRRDFQFGWFTSAGMTNAVNIFYDQLKNYSQDFNDISLDNSELDSLVKRIRANEKVFLSNRNNLRTMELMLTNTYFKYAYKVYGGTEKNTVDLEWFIPRKKKNYQVLIDSLISPNPDKTFQEPENQYYSRLKMALKEYREIEKKGGFPLIISNQKFIIAGDTNVCISKVKQYLLLTKDYAVNDTTPVYTDTLKSAVLLFQNRMGLPEHGKLDAATIREMNFSVSTRVRQIMINLERLRWVPVEVEDNYILVNIPEFRLHVLEKNKQVWVTNVVVGKTVNKTTIFKGNIANIVLNPYWNAPWSIVKNEIIPAMARDPNYISRNNMEIVRKKPLAVRQKPGQNNALGEVKFLFPNSYSIYLHDTPAKSLFIENKRAFSHGCIRVESPGKLARYLLRDEPNWLKKLDKIYSTDKETWIKVSPSVPVYIVYFTSWVDYQGRVNFRNDIYGHDKKLENEIFGVVVTGVK